MFDIFLTDILRTTQYGAAIQAHILDIVGYRSCLTRTVNRQRAPPIKHSNPCLLRYSIHPRRFQTFDQFINPVAVIVIVFRSWSDVEFMAFSEQFQTTHSSQRKWNSQTEALISHRDHWSLTNHTILWGDDSLWWWPHDREAPIQSLLDMALSCDSATGQASLTYSNCYREATVNVIGR